MSSLYCSDTVSITVTFNADLEVLRKQLDSICKQCRVIVIDNGSVQNLLSQISEYIHDSKNVEFISLKENIGISAAQNHAIQYAIESYTGIDYALLLDHDSVPPDNMVVELRSELKKLTAEKTKVAAIGPLLYDPRDKKYLGFHLIKGLLWKKVIPESVSGPIECDSLNSSGSLIVMSAIASVGLLEDEFFIDHGETEWCFRAISKGYKIFGTASVQMEHLMGDQVCEYWLLGWRRMPYRAPERHYYIVRNSVLMQKKTYVPLIWKFWNIGKILFTFFYFSFFSDSRSQHRKYILKGVRDGVNDVKGRLID